MGRDWKQPRWDIYMGVGGLLLPAVTAGERFKALAIIGGTAEGVAYTNFVDECHKTNLIPVCVTKFWSTGPRFAGINKGHEKGSYFRAENGGHFGGYFGVGAGADSFVLSNAPNQEVLCWKAGVYLFWHDE